MEKVIEQKMATCLRCGRSKPLDAEHWRRNRNLHSGFDRYCKLCCQKAIKDHYRKFNRHDKAARGKVGVKCLLWSPRCGVCPCTSVNDVSACWRIAEIDPTSESYPEGLNHEAP
jgi:hypothetical protein